MIGLFLYLDLFFIEMSSEMPLWGEILLCLLLTGFFGMFILFGFNWFIKNYRGLVDIYKGFLIGKISLIIIPFFMIGSTFMLAISLFTCIFPLLAAHVFIMDYYNEKTLYINPEDYFIQYPNLEEFLILGSILLLVLIPLTIAFFQKKPHQEFKLSLIKSDKQYIVGEIFLGISNTSITSDSKASFYSRRGRFNGDGANSSW